MAADDELRRLDALLALGLRLARSAPSGRTALGQLADVIDLDWIPQPRGRELTSELRAAHAQATEPLGPDRVERVLREAWDEPPERVLDRLDPEPVLITATAQTHRAEHGGRMVAVKVIRPGLPALVRQDLALLELLAAPLVGAFPALDVGALLREVRERVRDDLDLDAQARALRRFHRALRDHPRFVVPAPVAELCDDTVLVREWVDGTPLADAPSAARDRAAADLVVFALGAARWGTAHADLRREEVFVCPDGRLAVADVGASAPVDPGRLDAVAGLVEAFVTDDPVAAAEHLEALGWLPAARAGELLEFVREVLGPFAGVEPVRLDSGAVLAMRDRLIARPGPAVRLLVAGRLEPQDLWPARGLGQLFALIARVGATAPWRELVRTGLRDGWDGGG